MSRDTCVPYPKSLRHVVEKSFKRPKLDDNLETKQNMNSPQGTDDALYNHIALLAFDILQTTIL
jgi:hypothetical protein